MEIYLLVLLFDIYWKKVPLFFSLWKYFFPLNKSREHFGVNIYQFFFYYFI